MQKAIGGQYKSHKTKDVVHRPCMLVVSVYISILSIVSTTQPSSCWIRIVPCVVTLLNTTHRFMWHITMFATKNGHHKGVCCNEIGLCASMLFNC